MLQGLDVGLSGEVDHDAGDIRGLVADAFHVRDHLKRRGDEAEVFCHGLLLQQEFEAEGLDIPLLLIHLAVKRNRVVGGLHVLLDECLACGLNRMLDQRAHFEQLLI